MTDAMPLTAAPLTGKTIMIGAGGTGGHVYPALAVAHELQALGATVHWLGTAEGIESRLVPDAGLALSTIRIQGVRGNGLKRLVKAPLAILHAIRQAKAVLSQYQPDVYIGFGGFASGPGAAAAKWLSIPVIIHEQNAAMGLTNRLASRWAKRVLLAFPLAREKTRGERNHGHSRGEIVGNPVRQSIAQLAAQGSRYGRLHDANQPVRVLIVGGSLGAKAINEVIPEAVLPLLPNITVTHQTGATTFEQTSAAYQALGILAQVDCRAYIDDMAAAYANSDLVIARAGALTVSEIATVGLAAIFVPLPHAVDNHQFLNAKFLVDAGAAVIVPQDELTAHRLKNEIQTLMAAKTQLSEMGNHALQQSHAHALSTIVAVVQEVLDDV
ncbi:undecaprenyldiphospho-muramoylpentapeptide beta-N-acetylglucosaminyltransferase [Ostreibacterium oceani]|nr:undecaprenyldiphospho-muramoylpentapeptide beta-N-acetylglucosaminyltransferase [Ostreibacterium oceani]